ncbi:glycosyl hydrolase, family 92 protein [Sporothrix brasiliensis 5110]|uniref:Glycosyl hydrolase, family 92 protein n=1 Tax=Sporothrix brasiliensis 5110 TaxID=1398154 RepID=A0A0C2ITT6_9PEZI|nr:glycosyl hydrolase, family 92 protein [Sporothrix brasiliensis 5110]KIH90190.1 glycosyl hydrolase, family 92 protein [Sporothrix brasiliensis 5110]
MAGLATAADLASYVLPLIGTEAGGNTFPGVSEPFGMVKLGPDMDTGPDATGSSYSGYVPGAAFFTGFSMLHESGTGGAPKYGVVSQMPVAGTPVENPLLRHADARGAVADEASPGSYKATMASGIVVELAASSRAGLYQYTFPNSASGTNSVIVDVSHFLPAPDRAYLSQHYLGGNISVSSKPDGSSLQYQGAGTYNNGWNLSPAWTVYFCGYFDSPGTVQTFVGTSSTGSTMHQFPAASTVDTSPNRLGAVFSFNSTSTNTVTSRVGVSFMSTAQACSNVNSQVPPGTNRTALEAQTRAAWNDQVLSKITTTDRDNTTRLQLLYSSLYHMFLLPQNKTGENPLWTSSEPYYDDVFTLWDLPTMYEEFIRSLVDIWRHEGFMPDARSSFFNGVTQGGSNADNVLADAYVKGVRGSINWYDAYAAMVTNAETVPVNNNDPRDPTGSTKEGRGALPDWHNYGFITRSYGRSVTRAVEYSVNDFSLYQVASGLGKASDASKYLDRSRNWRKHWNPSAASLGFSGGADYEALSWEYSFNAHHDMKALVNYSGGDTAFSNRLAMMFVPGQRPIGSAQFNNTIFNPGNEPSFTTPYLFNFVGRQDLSVQHSRAAADAYYLPTPGGLPGNSDAGAMESWVLWSMIGLYPITGQTTFLIGSPWFHDLTISLGGGKTLQITSTNVTTTTSSSQAIFVQSLKVNGQPWNRSWLTYDDIFANGGRLDFVLGPRPSNWSTDGIPPPSPATEDIVPPPLVLPSVVDQDRFSWRVDRPVLASLVSAVCATLVISAVYLCLRRRRSQLLGKGQAHQIPTTEVPPPSPPQGVKSKLLGLQPRVLQLPAMAFQQLRRGSFGSARKTDVAVNEAAVTTGPAVKAIATTVSVKAIDDLSVSDSQRTDRCDDDAPKSSGEAEVASPVVLQPAHAMGLDAV